MPVTLNRHSVEQKQFIVRMLARFYVPKDIAVAFCARFTDTACTEHDVRATDPTTQLVDPMLDALFKSERGAIIADPGSATYADKKARLIRLSRDVDFHYSNNEIATARSVMRQIAEELGETDGPAGNEPVEAIEIVVVDPKPREATNGTASK